MLSVWAESDEETRSRTARAGKKRGDIGLLGPNDAGPELRQSIVVLWTTLRRSPSQGQSDVSCSPERGHVLDVLEAGAGVEDDHAVVRAHVPRGLQLTERRDAGAGLGRDEQALGGGRVLHALDDLLLRNGDRRAMALAHRPQDQEVPEDR